VKTILCLPGNWPDAAAFRLAASAIQLPAAGSFIVDTVTGSHVEFEITPRDPRMRDAFASASGGEVEGEELDAIAAHQSVLYLLGETGDLDKLKPLIQIATRLLPHGALGIKVESAGVAAPIERWLALSVRLDPFGLIRCFVVVGHGDERTYSCGMHNLGLPDVVINDVATAEAAHVINRFNLYQLIERPTLSDGQTFATEAGARAFTMHKEPCTMWPQDDPYFNPFGMWRLVPVAATTPAA
jgi:hypothetical protein